MAVPTRVEDWGESADRPTGGACRTLHAGRRDTTYIEGGRTRSRTSEVEGSSKSRRRIGQPLNRRRAACSECRFKFVGKLTCNAEDISAGELSQSVLAAFAACLQAGRKPPRAAVAAKEPNGNQSVTCLATVAGGPPARSPWDISVLSCADAEPPVQQPPSSIGPLTSVQARHRSRRGWYPSSPLRFAPARCRQRYLRLWPA